MRSHSEKLVISLDMFLRISESLYLTAVNLVFFTSASTYSIVTRMVCSFEAVSEMPLIVLNLFPLWKSLPYSQRKLILCK